MGLLFPELQPGLSARPTRDHLKASLGLFRPSVPDLDASSEMHGEPGCSGHRGLSSVRSRMTLDLALNRLGSVPPSQVDGGRDNLCQRGRRHTSPRARRPRSRSSRAASPDTSTARLSSAPGGLGSLSSERPARAPRPPSRRHTRLFHCCSQSGGWSLRSGAGKVTSRTLPLLLIRDAVRAAGPWEGRPIVTWVAVPHSYRVGGKRVRP